MMILVDLVLETVIRDGIELIRRKPVILERIFGNLTNENLQLKYGEAEINRIKAWIANDEIAIVQAFSQVNTNLPCVSIQLLAEDEDIPLTILGDYQGQEEELFDECGEDSPILRTDFEVTSYDSEDQRLYVPDTNNLTDIHPNLLVMDSDGEEYKIISPISEEAGAQFITIEVGENQPNPNITTDLIIKSSINSHTYEVEGTREQSRLLLGIHTEERLTTIYLFNIIKFFIQSRKKELEENCLELSTYNASDFTRNQDVAEPVFSRFMTFKSMVEHTWRGEEFEQLDWAEVVAVVQDNEELKEETGQAYCNNEHLGLEDATIQIKTEDDE